MSSNDQSARWLFDFLYLIQINLFIGDKAHFC